MYFRLKYFYFIFLLLVIAAKADAQKSVEGIVKLDLFAPFTGNVYASYQFKPEKKYFSPEVGIGLIGPWASKYTGQTERNGVYARAGLFIINGTPESNPKNIWRNLYVKPEIALFQHHAEYAYDSRKLNPNTGFFEDAVKKESYDIKGACLIINIGKQIQFNRWVVDFSVGFGAMQTIATHHKNDPNILSKKAEFIFPIQGPFPIYSINTFTNMIQGGIKIGYQLY